MYHISDLKKYSRCPRLFQLDRTAEKAPFQKFIRLDEAVTDLAKEKLGIKECFLGARNDPPELALEALKTEEWLVKARFEYRQLRVKVPFLHRNGDGWDLYFLFVGLYPHADDRAFYCDTVYALQGIGLNLKDIRIIHLNADYVRKGELDTGSLFKVSDCFYTANNNPSQNVKDMIMNSMSDISQIMDEMDRLDHDHPEAPVRTSKCTGRQKCRFYDSCFEEEAALPHNSILTLTGARYKYRMQSEGREFLADADPELIEGSPQQYAEIMADRKNGLFIDRMAVKTWLRSVSYPVTFLDFEWERYAIPPYDGMKPYDVLPFEYSVHVLHENGDVSHNVFLSVHDDRQELIESMLKDIPGQGTVMAYNAEGAEMIRISEMAEQFPQYARQLLDINSRMKDMQVPFVSGMVYDTRMAGVWSLKKIMSMMNDRSYKDLDINQGMDAVYNWRMLDREESDTDSGQIISQLKEYCGMDTYALMVVYKWLKEIAE